MAEIFSLLSVGFVPSMALLIAAYGLAKKAPVYDYFIEGARKGLAMALDILPFLIGIFLAVNCLTVSGVLNLLDELFAPVFDLISVPAQLLPLILLRAVSGSGSLIILRDVLSAVGPDSYAGRAACVMTGGCETVIYVLALYFGVTHVKKMRHALKGGLIGYFAGIVFAFIICRFI